MPTATANPRRDVHRGSWLAVGALVVTAAVIFGLTYDGSDHPTATKPTTTGPTTRERTSAIVSDTRHEFRSLDELVLASDLVVSGRVIATEAGRVFGGDGAEPGSAAIRSHLLTLRVDSVLAGSGAKRTEQPKDDTVVLVEEEAELTDGTPVAVDGMRASRVGDDGLWFLVASGDPDFPAYAVVNSQGRYLRDASGALHGGDASDALVAQLSHLGRSGLVDAVAGVTPR